MACDSSTVSTQNETKTTVGLWREVWKFVDAAELAMAAVSVLSLPHSNAEVEVLAR